VKKKQQERKIKEGKGTTKQKMSLPATLYDGQGGVVETKGTKNLAKKKTRRGGHKRGVFLEGPPKTLAS